MDDRKEEITQESEKKEGGRVVGAGYYAPSSRDIRAQCLHTTCEHMARHMPGVTPDKVIEAAAKFADFIDNGLPEPEPPTA